MPTKTFIQRDGFISFQQRHNRSVVDPFRGKTTESARDQSQLCGARDVCNRNRVVVLLERKQNKLALGEKSWTQAWKKIAINIVPTTSHWSGCLCRTQSYAAPQDDRKRPPAVCKIEPNTPGWLFEQCTVRVRVGASACICRRSWPTWKKPITFGFVLLLPFIRVYYDSLLSTWYVHLMPLIITFPPAVCSCVCVCSRVQWLLKMGSVFEQVGQHWGGVR